REIPFRKGISRAAFACRNKAGHPLRPTPIIRPDLFTSQSLPAVPKPGSVGYVEHRLDDVVHQLDVLGTLEDASELTRRVDAALAGGVRWLILDLAEAPVVSDVALEALVDAAGALRARKGELIVAGAQRGVAERLAGYDVAHRPAMAANV